MSAGAEGQGAGGNSGHTGTGAGGKEEEKAAARGMGWLDGDMPGQQLGRTPGLSYGWAWDCGRTS